MTETKETQVMNELKAMREDLEHVVILMFRNKRFDDDNYEGYDGNLNNLEYVEGCLIKAIDGKYSSMKATSEFEDYGKSFEHDMWECFRPYSNTLPNGEPKYDSDDELIYPFAVDGIKATFIDFKKHYENIAKLCDMPTDDKLSYVSETFELLDEFIGHLGK